MKALTVLFGMFFFAVCAAAVGMMALGMCENPTAEAKVENLSAEEENALLAIVEFRLDGTPTGEPALFLDVTMITRLTVGETTRLPLVGNERCGVSLKVQGTDGEWTHVTSIGCIKHAPYAAIGFAVEGLSAKVSEGTWR